MRHKTLRKITPSTPKISDSEKVRMLRTLYIMVFNSDDSIVPLATELFHIMGEILEGTPAEQLDLNGIDRNRFLQELAEIS